MKEVRIYKNIEELSVSLAERVFKLINQGVGDHGEFYLSLSGGNTPPKLFAQMIKNRERMLYWNKLWIFWTDERCVPPEHEQSNFGMASRELIVQVPVDNNKIYRMKGEDLSEVEAERYGRTIQELLPSPESKPVFDLILLGMGTDGHTASIFPGQTALFDSENNCAASVHPVTGQKRITLTGRVLNHARHIIFMVSGRDKAEMLGKVLNGKGSIDYPASLVRPVRGTLEWYIDKEAAGRL